MTRSGRGVLTVGLLGVNLAIDYNGDEARSFLEFLFADLQSEDQSPASRRFEVIIVGKPTKMSLWLEEKQLYFGESKQAMACIMINEILYDCIVNNSQYYAVHAAAFSLGGRGILFPGKSGSGKSSLAAWLTGKGYTYLTDELVLLSRDGRMFPFTRPIFLKPSAFGALARYFSLQDEDILTGEKGSMIPHRLLNPHWAGANPLLDTIVYPEFSEGRQTVLTGLSSAQSCLKLMGCYVNARNIPNHGFSEVADLTRKAAAYDLKFGGFDGVLAALQPILSAEL